jgi:hypothetical protein
MRVSATEMSARMKPLGSGVAATPGVSELCTRALARMNAPVSGIWKIDIAAPHLPAGILSP